MLLNHRRALRLVGVLAVFTVVVFVLVGTDSNRGFVQDVDDWFLDVMVGARVDPLVWVAKGLAFAGSVWLNWPIRVAARSGSKTTLPLTCPGEAPMPVLSSWRSAVWSNRGNSSRASWVTAAPGSASIHQVTSVAGVSIFDDSGDIRLDHIDGDVDINDDSGFLRIRDVVGDVFLIDDGFTPEMGDWLDVKPQFPRGMKAILDDVRSAGFMPRPSSKAAHPCTNSCGPMCASRT